MSSEKELEIAVWGILEAAVERNALEKAAFEPQTPIKAFFPAGDHESGAYDNFANPHFTKLIRTMGDACEALNALLGESLSKKASIDIEIEELYEAVPTVEALFGYWLARIEDAR